MIQFRDFMIPTVRRVAKVGMTNRGHSFPLHLKKSCMYRKDEPLHIAHPILEISSNIDVDRQIRFCDRIIAVKIAQAATVDLDNLYAIESERAIYEGIKENLKILEVLFKIKNENIIY